jgi:hypothetical protein
MVLRSGRTRWMVDSPIPKSRARMTGLQRTAAGAPPNPIPVVPLLESNPRSKIWEGKVDGALPGSFLAIHVYRWSPMLTPRLKTTVGRVARGPLGSVPTVGVSKSTPIEEQLV